MTKSTRPEARNLAMPRRERFNVVTLRGLEVSTVKGYATLRLFPVHGREDGLQKCLKLVGQFQVLAVSDLTKDSASAGPSCRTSFT